MLLPRACVLVLACLTLACASERSTTERGGAEQNQPNSGDDKPANATDVQSTPPSTPEPTGEPPVFEDGKVRVVDTPLPFSLALGDSGMSGDRSGDGDYLTLSGPPGGPLMLRVYPSTVGADLEKLIAGLRPEATLTPDKVTFFGAELPAVSWISGEGFSRTVWCAVIVAPPDSQPGKAALLFEFGAGRDDGGDCKWARGHHVLGPVLDSLAFD